MIYLQVGASNTAIDMVKESKENNQIDLHFAQDTLEVDFSFLKDEYVWYSLPFFSLQILACSLALLNFQPSYVPHF